MTPSRPDRSSSDGVSATDPAGKRVGVRGGAVPEELAAVLVALAAVSVPTEPAPSWRRTRIAALARHPHPRTV
ncbi:hypothetical protein GCM10027265_37040 [Jatrophihabitans fulvus]